MSKERRQHERFSMSLNARRITDDGREIPFEIKELSVGGCFAEWFEEAVPGYVFDIKFPLSHGGWMPLTCAVRYRYMTIGIGVQFVDITYVEQEPIAEVIMNHLWEEGLSVIDPFAPPKSLDKPRTVADE